MASPSPAFMPSPDRDGSAAEESLEDAVPHVRRDADARVADEYLDVRRVALDGQLDRALGAVVLHGVVQQVVDDLAELVRVGVDVGRGLTGQGVGQRQPLRLGQRPDDPGALPGQFHHVDRLRPEAVHPRVDAGQRQEAFDDLVHVQGAGLAVLDHLAVLVRGARLAEGQFERGQHGGERRPQLVADVGGRLLLPREGPLELVERLAEAIDDRLQLGRHRGVAEREAEVLLRDPADGVREPTQRRQARPDEPAGTDDGGDEGRRRDGQQPVALAGEGQRGLAAQGGEVLVA